MIHENALNHEYLEPLLRPQLPTPRFQSTPNPSRDPTTMVTPMIASAAVTAAPAPSAVSENSKLNVVA